MARIWRFFLIVGYLAVSGWVIDNTPFDEAARILTLAADGGILFLALTALGRTWDFYGTRTWLFFLLAAAVTMVYNLDRIGPLGQLNGLRLPLFFFAVLIVVRDFLTSPHAALFDRLFVRFLVLYALAQVPTSVVQFLQYGPSDYVGGTLGWGGPNAVTLSLFLIVFYLIARYAAKEDGSAFRIGKVLAFSLLLFPCAINETKISFVLLPLMMMLLVPIRRMAMAIPMILVGAALFVALNALYSTYERDTEFLLDERFLERYLYYDEAATGDLPRGQKLLYTMDLMHNDPPLYLVGMGYGIFAGGNILQSSSFGYIVSYLGGARMFLNTVWLQGGLLAVGLIAYALFHFAGTRRITAMTVGRFRIFLVLVLAAMWVYNDSLYSRVFAAIASYLVLWTEAGGRIAGEQGKGGEEGDEEYSEEALEAR